MGTQAATGAGAQAAQRVDEQFLELICSDGALLQAEFDAIIAAEWREPPASTPGRGFVDRRPTIDAARRTVAPHGVGLPGRPRRPGAGGWARQRAPPPQMTTTTKGR
jgi:hypothetical protein